MEVLSGAFGLHSSFLQHWDRLWRGERQYFYGTVKLFLSFLHQLG